MNRWTRRGKTAKKGRSAFKLPRNLGKGMPSATRMLVSFDDMERKLIAAGHEARELTGFMSMCRRCSMISVGVVGPLQREDLGKDLCPRCGTNSRKVHIAQSLDHVRKLIVEVYPKEDDSDASTHQAEVTNDGRGSVKTEE